MEWVYLYWNSLCQVALCMFSETSNMESDRVSMYLTRDHHRGNISCIALRVWLDTKPVISVSCHPALSLSVIHKAIQHIVAADQSGCIFREIHVEPSVNCVDYKLSMICYRIRRRLTFGEVPKQSIICYDQCGGGVVTLCDHDRWQRNERIRYLSYDIVWCHL